MTFRRLSCGSFLLSYCSLPFSSQRAPRFITPVLLWQSLNRAERPPHLRRPSILRPPTDFVEIKEKNGTLFAENARQLGERARLLRLFLPENQAHFYEEGKHYALTRQLAVYGIAKANDAPFNKDDIALLGRILEEGFLSFDKAPSAALRDSLALEEVLLQAGRDGRNLLLDTRSTENLRLFQYQLAYPLSPGHAGSPADDRMLTSLTTLILLGARAYHFHLRQFHQHAGPPVRRRSLDP